MAVKEAKDIQVYTDSGWKTLKNQKVHDGNSWRNFGVGSGVSNGSDWYVLKSEGDTGGETEQPTDNKISLHQMTGSYKYGRWLTKFYANSNKNTASDVNIRFRVTVHRYDSPTYIDKYIDVKIGKGKGYGENEVDFILDYSKISHIVLAECSISPNKDSHFNYELKNSLGSNLSG